MKNINYEDYIKGLNEILEKIEKSTLEKNYQKVQEWFSYLQGYIKASGLLK